MEMKKLEKNRVDRKVKGRLLIKREGHPREGKGGRGVFRKSLINHSMLYAWTNISK